MKTYTLLKPVKIRGILRQKGGTINDTEVSAAVLKWLWEQDVIANPDKQATIVLPATALPKAPFRTWPTGCCGRR